MLSPDGETVDHNIHCLYLLFHFKKSALKLFEKINYYNDALTSHYFQSVVKFRIFQDGRYGTFYHLLPANVQISTVIR